MIKKTLTIHNKTGLHCRPCSEIVNVAKQYKSEIFIVKDDESANAKSMMDIIILSLKKGDVISLKVSGEDEDLAFKNIAKLVVKEYFF